MTLKPNSLCRIDGQIYIYFSGEQVFCHVPDGCLIMHHIVYGPTHGVDESGQIKLGPKIPLDKIRGCKFSKVVVSDFFAAK